MKRTIATFMTLLLAVSMLMMTGCGKSEFACSDVSENSMEISAENASKDSSVLSGGLEVIDGDWVTIETNLEKGEIAIEFFAVEGEEDLEKTPVTDQEAELTVNASGNDSQAYELQAGTYRVKATVVDTATGSVSLSVGAVG